MCKKSNKTQANTHSHTDKIQSCCFKFLPAWIASIASYASNACKNNMRRAATKEADRHRAFSRCVVRSCIICRVGFKPFFPNFCVLGFRSKSIQLSRPSAPKRCPWCNLRPAICLYSLQGPLSKRRSPSEQNFPLFQNQQRNPQDFEEIKFILKSVQVPPFRPFSFSFKPSKPPKGAYHPVSRRNSKDRSIKERLFPDCLFFFLFFFPLPSLSLLPLSLCQAPGLGVLSSLFFFQAHKRSCSSWKEKVLRR